MKTFLILGKKKINITKQIKEFGIESLITNIKFEVKCRNHKGLETVFTAYKDDLYCLNERMRDETLTL